MPNHTTERDQIFYTPYYNRIWIPSLNKDKGIDIHRQFSETKNVGNGVILSGLSYHCSQGNTQCLCFF